MIARPPLGSLVQLLARFSDIRAGGLMLPLTRPMAKSSAKGTGNYAHRPIWVSRGLRWPEPRIVLGIRSSGDPLAGSSFLPSALSQHHLARVLTPGAFPVRRRGFFAAKNLTGAQPTTLLANAQPL
jgi:hypothetical protein